MFGALFKFSFSSGEKQPARDNEVYDIEYAEYPAPADKEEEQERHKVQRAARAQKYAQPYKTFAAPTYHGND